MNSKSESLTSNFSWKFAERITAQLVTLVVSIILARLLDPTDYGVIAIVTIFITLANVFVSDGFGSALIQKKNSDALDFSSVLYFNILFSIFLYLILFFVAPLISSFYGEGYEILVPVMRVIGLRLVISGVNSVQHAYVSKKMIFRKFFWSTLIGTVVSAIVGIYMAYTGFGVWALVGQYLTNTFIDTIVLSISIHRMPLFAFSFKRLKKLFGFGAKVLGTNILITSYVELRAILIGKVYSSADLAYYNKGEQFPKLIITNVNVSVSSVLFPRMSNMQYDKFAVKSIARKSIRVCSYLMCPLMLGMLIVAEPFVRLVLTEKWLQCVPYLQLFCIIYLFYPIHSTNMQVIKAMGRGNTYLILETVKKVIELIVLLIVVWISVKWIVLSTAILTTLFTFINAFPNRKIINYSFKEQIVDILPALIMSTIMIIVVYVVSLINLPLVISFLLQIFIGAIIYLTLSIVTKNKEMKFLIDKIKRVLRK